MVMADWFANFRFWEIIIRNEDITNNDIYIASNMI